MLLPSSALCVQGGKIGKYWALQRINFPYCRFSGQLAIIPWNMARTISAANDPGSTEAVCSVERLAITNHSRNGSSAAMNSASAEASVARNAMAPTASQALLKLEVRINAEPRQGVHCPPKFCNLAGP
jgi:hypothetical protein